jgi:hypothetical protein
MATEVETNLFGLEIDLSGQDGNAMAIISRCRRAARLAGISPEDIDKFTADAMSGDYDHVLQTCMRYFDVS